MKKTLNYFFAAILLLIIITGCEQKDKDIYEIPEWLGGTLRETLEKKGNYTIFLELMEKAGYAESMERNLFTAFVADDDAFREYFASVGIVDVSTMTEDEARLLFTLNIINTPRSRQQLIYEFASGVWGDSASEYGALFFRWPTNSESLIEKEIIKYYLPLKDVEVHIKSKKKYVPCLSREYFRDFAGAPDGSDYTFFFPNTPWTGLQWYNAAVTEQETRCSNGFIYFIDRVVPIIPSIEEYLRRNQDKFGIFYDLTQRYAKYSFSGVSTDGKYTPYYTKSYTGFTDFADEDGPAKGGWNIYLRRNTYSALIPLDNVFQEYLNNTVFKYYESIDSVPEVTLTYLIQAHITSQFEVISKIKKSFYNAFGDKIDINPDGGDIEFATLLSNGPLFAMNKVLEPLAFRTVPGPLFYNSNYTTFLHALNQTGMIPSLSFTDVPVTIFAPDNEMLLAYGFKYDKIREELQKRDIFGVWNRMESYEIEDLVKDHIIFEEISDLSGERFLLMNSDLIVYINNGALEAGGNQEDGDNAVMKEAINSNINGYLFYIDNAIKAPELNVARYVANNPDFSELFNLMCKAELIDTIIDIKTEIEYPNLRFLSEPEQWTAFLPDNDAIIQAYTEHHIPDSINELKEFILYHFVPSQLIVDLYPVVSDTVRTASKDSTGHYLTVEINATSKNLSVTDGSGQTVNVTHSTANRLVTEGIIQRIKSVLKPE